MPRSLPTLLEYRALAEFRYQLRSFLSFSERAARAAGLEPQQHQLLLATKGLPLGMRPTIGTLAKRLCVEHHTAVALVDKLSAAGFVRRVASERDRREVLVEITPDGERILASLSTMHRNQLREVAPTLLKALTSVLTDRATQRERTSPTTPR
ncbi:MAG: MarR family transcriptional regulator [Polyangiales bacterium]